MSFDVLSAPDGSSHGQCVSIPGSPRFRETVGMALLPDLNHCAASVNIAVARHISTLREDRPSIQELVRN